MPKTYRTSRPEINKLFSGSLPEVGVTLIVGPDKSGKTLLAMDIVREVMKTFEDNVLILSESPSKWQRVLDQSPNLTIRPTLNPDDLALADLVVVDHVLMSGPLLAYSQQKPVLLTGASLTVLQAFQSAHLILRTDRLEDGLGKVTVVKSRDWVNGEAVIYKVDPILGIVAQEYKAPILRSSWDRLLDDEDLV